MTFHLSILFSLSPVCDTYHCWQVPHCCLYSTLQSQGLKGHWKQCGLQGCLRTHTTKCLLLRMEQEDTAESQTGKEKNMELCSETPQGSESPLITKKEHPNCLFEERLCKGLCWSLIQEPLTCHALVPQSWMKRSSSLRIFEDCRKEMNLRVLSMQPHYIKRPRKGGFLLLPSAERHRNTPNREERAIFSHTCPYPYKAQNKSRLKQHTVTEQKKRCYTSPNPFSFLCATVISTEEHF